MSNMQKAVLIGSGGVGTITALALEHTGKCQVTVVARSVYERVKEHGWSIDSVDYGKIDNWHPHAVVPSVEAAAESGPYDYIFVVTKYIPELQRTEDLIRPLVSPGCGIVLIQNGIGNEGPVMEAFPQSYVIGGVSVIGSANYGGRIQHTLTDKVHFGTLEKRPEAIEKTHELVKLYNCSKSEAIFHPDIAYRRWCKLIYNATLNTTCALTGLDTGRIIFSGLKDSLVRPAMKEVRAIAEAETGKKLPTDIEEETIDSNAGTFYEPSMLIDVKKGQVMELEPILGNPLRYGAENGVETPTLRGIYKMLRGKQFAMLEKYGKYKLPTEPFDRDLARNLMDKLPWES